VDEVVDKNEGQEMAETGDSQGAPIAKRSSNGRKKKASARLPKVYVLDDDAGEVEAIRAVLEGEKFVCSTFTRPQDCIAGIKENGCDALLCDLVMPEMDGNQVLAEVKGMRPDLPVIVITGHGNIPVAVTAMRNGAANFIEKPFDGAALVQSIRVAMSEANKNWSGVPVKLSKRERLVLKHILKGNGNRHIALKLGKSIRTVEDHRSHLMKKMGVDNIVDLVKRSIALGLDDTSGFLD
jgi:two-component system, LuxR family, response regulator FixJ